MTNLANDSVLNVIHRGMKEPIRLLLERNYLEATLKLVCSGIDTMAFLDLPSGQSDVHGSDFRAWCERYLHLPGTDTITPLELWGARCGLLRCHSADSQLHRAGRVRLVFYTDTMSPPVRYRPDADPSIVVVSVHALATAFLDAIDRFLVDLFKDPIRAATANERFQNMLHMGPASE